jgi:hypothetical protein
MRKLLLLAVVIPLWAQQPSNEGPARRRPMPEPKNLQVLKIPASELIPTMRAYSAALGVRCSFCHVEGNFAADDKPQKKMARRMISMTQDINARFEDNKVHVTCYTCHRGDEEPKTAPSQTEAEPSKPAQK